MSNKFEFIQASNTVIGNEEIIDDLKTVAKKLQKNTVTQKNYNEHGKYDCSTVCRKFGTWNKALKTACFSFSNESNITDERLFENILKLWQHLGQQPRRKDLTLDISEFSQSPYNRRFKTWTNALQSFVNYANSEDLSMPEINNDSTNHKIKTGRDPSLRLRYQVLK